MIKYLFIVVISFAVITGFIGEDKNNKYDYKEVIAKDIVKNKKLTKEEIISLQKRVKKMPSKKIYANYMAYKELNIAEPENELYKDKKENYFKKVNIAKDKVTIYFKSNKEPKVLDAVWTDTNIFKVGVINNGSNRNEFADYVCLQMSERGISHKNLWIQVIDIQKLVTSKEWVTIGETYCN